MKRPVTASPHALIFIDSLMDSACPVGLYCTTESLLLLLQLLYEDTCTINTLLSAFAEYLLLESAFVPLFPFPRVIEVSI